MRVLLIHNRYQQSGGEDEVLRQELASLIACGHKVSTYLRNNDDIQPGALVAQLTLGLKTVWAWDSYRELRAVLAAEKPDVAHFHNTFPRISPAAYDACRAAGVAVVQTLHNYRLLCPAAILFRDGKICEECTEHSLLRSVAHSCYRGSRAASGATALMLAVHRARRTWTKRVDCYIALTEFAKRKFIAGGLPAERIAVKPNFVEPDPGVKTGTGKYALFVGRLSPEKGVRTLLAAWERQHSIPLVIAGDGPLRAEVEASARTNSSVVFKGWLPQEEVLSLMKGALFLVFPSEWYEQFPMSIVQSFACGTPVMFADVGTLPHIVTDNRTGVAFRAGDADNLAEKSVWAWTHQADMAAMGREARSDYETKYTARRHSDRLMEIYELAMRSAGLGARLAEPVTTCSEGVS
jgi:glycosyltransferase involved in cell wall biosynthesis